MKDQERLKMFQAYLKIYCLWTASVTCRSPWQWLSWRCRPRACPWLSPSVVGNIRPQTGHDGHFSAPVWQVSKQARLRRCCCCCSNSTTYWPWTAVPTRWFWYSHHTSPSWLFHWRNQECGCELWATEPERAWTGRHFASENRSIHTLA